MFSQNKMATISSTYQSYEIPVTSALVATSDPKLLSLLSMALRQTGIEVQEFQTLSGIPENADTYRLFVVDGDIKPGNAIELSRDLRRQQSTVDAARVLLSFDEAIDAYDAGVDMVMAKPVSINLFMARIRSILRRYNSFR